MMVFGKVERVIQKRERHESEDQEGDLLFLAVFQNELKEILFHRCSVELFLESGSHKDHQAQAFVRHKHADKSNRDDNGPWGVRSRGERGSR